LYRTLTDRFWHIAYTTACCYRTSRDKWVGLIVKRCKKKSNDNNLTHGEKYPESGALIC